jgi:hypothetical protein
MRRNRRAASVSLMACVLAAAPTAHFASPSEAHGALATSAQGPTAGEWALMPGARLFTAAGRDAGPAPPRGSTGPATDREAEGASVVALPGNAFLIVDVSRDRWLRVDARGRMAPLPGSRQLPDNTHSVAAAPDGSVLVANANKVLRLATDGTLSTLFDGAGQPAGDVQATGLAVRADGGVLIADGGHNRVLLLRDGAVSTVAGMGAGGQNSGDGGPATAAVLPDPEAVSVSADDSFLVTAGTSPAVIRRVDASGHISTVAGGAGVDTAAGGGCVTPGTPARALKLDAPSTVALPDSSFLIVAGLAIYHVGSDGRVAVIVCDRYDQYATGCEDYWDGAPAPKVELGPLGYPAGAAVTSDGGLLVATPRNVTFIPPRGGGQRLAAALPAANLARVPAGRVVVDLTLPADVTVSVRLRSGRTAATLRAHLESGRHELPLRRRLAGGEYRLNLIARGSDGQIAIDRLAVLGRHQLDLGVLRRALDGMLWTEDTSLGEAHCRRRARLRAFCRATQFGVEAAGRVSFNVRLRRDGLLEGRTDPRDPTSRFIIVLK